jgi:SAM-dependent methyltransferase
VEWGFMIGVFQTLLNVHLEKRVGYQILDVGCGTGLMAVASEPFVQDDGHYIGIDVSLKDIQFCQSHYKQPYFEFQHLNTYNARYAADGSQKPVPWDVASGSIDAVTAVSVWTHLNEQDACFYFSEIDRVLKPGGKALITFFLLDEFYDATVDSRTDQQGSYDTTRENLWVFDMPLSPSGDWRYPQRVEVPESAIGVTPTGVKKIIEGLSLVHKHTYLGNWKRLPGGSFQDVLVFEKP